MRYAKLLNQMIPNFEGWRLEFTESREQGFQRGDRDYEKNVRKSKVAKFVPSSKGF